MPAFVLVIVIDDDDDDEHEKAVQKSAYAKT